jgi:hypothetical protein
MKQCKLLAQQHRSLALAMALGLVILGLAFFAAPSATRAEDGTDPAVGAADPGTTVLGTVPPGTVPPIPSLQPSVTFVHAASFNANLALTAVDVCTEAGAVVTGLENVVFGEARTLYFNPASFDWKIARAGTNCTDVLVDIAPFGLGYNAVKVLVFAGDGSNQPLGVIDVFAREGGGVLFMPLITVNHRLG